MSSLSGPSVRTDAVEAGRSTPIRITVGLQPSRPTRSRSSLAPLSLIVRTKQADRAFARSRLLSRMSQRWAVKLQGTPASSAPVSASVALTEAQCACTCSASSSRIRRASQRPFG